jgi:hypothetical protein
MLLLQCLYDVGFHPFPVMSGFGARSRKLHGGFWHNQTFNLVDVNDRLWVGSRHGSDRAANGCFAPLLTNSCRSAIDPEVDSFGRFNALDVGYNVELPRMS